MGSEDHAIAWRRLAARGASADAHREEMWRVVRLSWQAQARRRRRLQAVRRWAGLGAGIAAVLVIGILIGRSPGLWSGGDIAAPGRSSDAGLREPTFTGGAEGPALADRDPASREAADLRLSTAYRIAIGEYFDEAETLLTLVAATEGDAQVDTGLSQLARELAARSRLLMDSRAGRDAEVRALLLDLELLLTQIARLVETRDPLERQIVDESVERSAVVPRLRSMSAERTDLIGI